MTQKTAVEWLYRWFMDNPEATYEEGKKAFQQAKQMENEQTIKRTLKGAEDTADYVDKVIVKALVEASKSMVIPEISDEEILRAAKECVYEDLDISIGSFELGARWYREQLKKK